MPVLLLFLGMLAMMLMRVYMPVRGVAVTGKPIKVVSLSVFERALMQRVNIYAIGGVLLLTTLAGLLPPAGELAIVMIAIGILFMPVRCILTTDGVAINNVVFRRWPELSGYTAERRRIRLDGQEGTRPMSIVLLPGKQGDVLPVIQRYLKPARPVTQRSLSGLANHASKQPASSTGARS